MGDAASDLASVVEGAAAAVGEAVASAALGWLLLGVLLHVGNQIARGQGWYAIVRTAADRDPRLRRRDAAAAWVAGAGASGVLSARGGDAVRVLLLSRRLRGTGCPVLAGTIVAEGAGELALGAAFVALAIAVGVGPELSAPGSHALGWIAGGAALAIGAGALAWRWPPVRRIAAGVGRGCAALRCPRAYAREVLPWQLASRLLRMAALACFLIAFGLPATAMGILLIMFAQGGGRLVPLAPAGVGATVGMLAASFGPVTGSTVSVGELATFLVGTSTVLTLVGGVLAMLIALRATDLPALEAGRRIIALQRTVRGAARA
jgi:uncharacterized membrane protein YbhN (UPF0104 family)